MLLGDVALRTLVFPTARKMPQVACMQHNSDEDENSVHFVPLKKLHSSSPYFYIQILRTKFDFDYDDVKEKLEKMSTEITYELSYKDVRKYLKEVIRLIGNSYSLIEADKKDCEAEKTIIKKVPF